MLLVGVSGTLVSMRIGARACLEAWRFQGTRGGLEWLEGDSRNMQRPQRSGFDLRLMRDMTNTLLRPCAYVFVCCETLVAPSMLTLCEVSECTVQYKAAPLSPSLRLTQQAKAAGVHAMLADRPPCRYDAPCEPSRHRLRLRVGRHLLASSLLPPKADSRHSTPGGVVLQMPRYCVCNGHA